MKQLARIMAESTSYPTISMEEELLAQAEAEDARVKAENAMDEAERVLDISECLEDLHFVVDRIKEVTPNEANLIQIVANTALAGTDASTDTIVPSQEDASAGDTRSARLRAVIDRIVAAVRELIAKLWDNVQNFVASITKTLGNVQRRVDMAYKRFDEAEFKMDDRLDIQIPPIVQGDKVLKDPRKILVGLRDYIKVVDEFIKDGNNRAHREGVYYSHLYTNFNGTADGAEESLRVLQELGRASKHSAATPNKSQSYSFDNLVTITNYTSDSLIGGIVLSYNEFDVPRPEGEDSNSPAIVARIASSIFHSGYRIAADENRPEVSQSVQADSFNKDEIRQLLGELRKMVELLQGSSMSLMSSLEERTRWAKDTAKKIETAVASYQPEMNGVKAMAEASLRTMTFLSHQASTPYNSLISNTMKMINLVLIGVTRSLDAHEQIAEAT